SKEAERAALKTICYLLIAAADFNQVIPITRSLEQQEFFLSRFAGEGISRFIIERHQLRLAEIRDGEISDDGGERSAISASSGECSLACCTAVDRPQHARSEGFARKEDAGHKAQGGIKVALEGRLEPGDIHAKFVEEVLRHAAVKRFRRLEGLAAAVARMRRRSKVNSL